MSNVLVVDNDETARRAVRRMLVHLGHQVWDVADGAEARQLPNSIRFDLIIADVYGASADGMELLLRIRQCGREVPVVAMSGGGFVATDEILAMARECGAAATLGKPFTPRQLRDAIGPLLENPEAHHRCAALAGPVRPDARRAERRKGAGHAIAIIGMFTGVFVMMASLPIGLILFAASAVIGWRLTSES